MTNKTSHELFTPTRAFLESIQVGDKAPNCWGEWKTITEIFGRGDDIKGKAYACYHVENGPNSTISNSLKEGELHRTVGIIAENTSAQLDAIEGRK